MKNRICFITADCFLDTDIAIIPKLNKYYNLFWIVVFSKGSQKYSPSDVVSFCNKNSINHKVFLYKYRLKDLRNFLFYIKIHRFIKKSKSDIVYFEFTGAPYFHLLSPFYLNRNKAVLAIHDVEEHIGINHLLIKNIYNKILFKYFRNFQFFSLNQKKIFEEKYKSKNCFAAPLALKDFGHLPDIKKNNKEINFLFFGSIRKNKGLGFLIKAANKLAGQYDNFKITIAGKCDEFEYYNSQIENNEVFDLNIYLIPNEKIPAFYAKADYLVLPYRDVTQSGPLLIAYNYNVPVIASDLPGFREYIVDNKTGFLFETENSESLENCMEKILKMNVYEHKQIKSNLEKFVKDECSLDSIINKYLSFFSKLQ